MLGETFEQFCRRQIDSGPASVTSSTRDGLLEEWQGKRRKRVRRPPLPRPTRNERRRGRAQGRCDGRPHRGRVPEPEGGAVLMSAPKRWCAVNLTPSLKPTSLMSI